MFYMFMFQKIKSIKKEQWEKNKKYKKGGMRKIASSQNKLKGLMGGDHSLIRTCVKWKWNLAVYPLFNSYYNIYLFCIDHTKKKKARYYMLYIYYIYISNKCKKKL